MEVPDGAGQGVERGGADGASEYVARSEVRLG